MDPPIVFSYELICNDHKLSLTARVHLLWPFKTLLQLLGTEIVSRS